MSFHGPVLQRLRSETAKAHQDLEDALDASSRLSSVTDRRALLPRYYRMHASADPELERWLGGLLDLDMPSRQRTAALTQDLEALGVEAPTRLPDVRFDSAAEALGFLYVLEGSSLGGRVILKSLAHRRASSDGLSFLDPYGEAVGDRWKAFVAVLEREGAADVEEVARGGVRGFDHARQCLLEEDA